MKLNAYLRNYTEDFGGAYTFEKEVVSNIGPLLKEYDVNIVDGMTEIKSGKQAVPDADATWFVTPFFAPTNQPYIATIWDIQHRLQPWFPEVSERGEWEQRDNFYSRLASKAFKILVCGQTLKSDISTIYSIRKERIKVVPLPTPEPKRYKIDVDFLKENGLEQNKFIFYPAQFWAHKNHVTILKAMALINSWGIEIKAVFTGIDKGNLEYIKKAVSDLGLDDQVVFPGFVSVEVIDTLYQTALCLVNPSLFGPQNLPPLEASIRGCPVIMAQTEGAVEQMGASAIYFSPLDYQHLATLIKEIYIEDDIKTMLRNLALTKRHFTGADYISSVKEVLNELDEVRNLWDLQRAVADDRITVKKGE
jgi:glycosyltransferase involved in cell wall biosynthesis